MIHDLKLSYQYFDDVDSGLKPFEVRKDDRTYTVGDLIRLREWRRDYTGRECTKEITYILKDKEYCKEGYCILGLREPNNPLSVEDLWKMDGEQIWIKLMENGFIEPVHVFASPFCPRVESRYTARYYFSQYGDRFLAYKYKPER